MDTTEKLTMVEWCAGYGGIHLGLKRAIPNLRVIAYGEIEAFACANLVAKMEAGLLDAAPIWTDIKNFPCEEFRDRVDILVAGYPCQPFSAAGKRLGAEDPRHLWPHIARAIRVIQPRLCFFENVEGHISLGLSTVISDLEELGYKVSWGIFSASEVGAPHQRKRVFIMAHRKCERLERWGQRMQSEGIECWISKHSWTSGNSSLRELAYPLCNGSREGRNLQQGTDGTIVICDGESGGAWPSRPGEPQHEWEPPRVVENSKFVGRRGRNHGDAGGSSGEIQAPRSCGARTEAMGDSESREDLGREPRDLGAEGGQGRCGDHAAGDAGEVVGDSECFCIPTTREHGAMGEMGAIPAAGEGSESPQTDSESSSARKREDYWADASECSETQPPLGECSDESSSILGQTLTFNPYGDNVCAYENISKKIRAREILFELWREANSQTIQWTNRGLQCFLAEKILLSGMQLDGFTQRICYFVWCIQTGHKAKGWGLSGMWVYEISRSSSRRSEPIEQFKRELGYAMCQLSYEIALERRKEAVEAKAILQGVRGASERSWAMSQALPEMEEVWRSSLDQEVWEKGCYIEASSQGNRTDELRLLGNGVVPATAERAFRVLMKELLQQK